MTMLKKMRENKKKGFTLVELIVVLVILAILAALLIPALTGYIDKAREKSVTAETRQAVMAAQTIADEEYGKATGTAAATDEDIKKVLQGTDSYGDVKKLAEVDGTINDVTVSGGKITNLQYTDKAGNKTCTYAKGANDTKGTYTVDDATKSE